MPWPTTSACAMQSAVADPWPKASTAGGATKQRAAKIASRIASLKRKPVVRAVSISLNQPPLGIVNSHRGIGNHGLLRRPLWVISGHRQADWGCPLCPQKQTFLGALSMSAKCQKWTCLSRGCSPFGFAAGPTPPAIAQEKPNIIFIMGDDIGCWVNDTSQRSQASQLLCPESSWNVVLSTWPISGSPYGWPPRHPYLAPNLA